MNRRRVTLAVALYVVLTIAGVGWAALRGRPDVLTHPEPWLALPAWRGPVASLALGSLLALGTLGLTRTLVRRAAWARALHLEFRRLLGALSTPTILVLALGSGIGEEIFFRGGLQPSIGWVATSLIFGVLHIGPTKRLLPWTAWAVVMGFLLGAIHQATGSLLGPLLAHVWINYENLHFIGSHDPREPSERAHARAPKLVGRPRRSIGR